MRCIIYDDLDAQELSEWRALRVTWWELEFLLMCQLGKNKRNNRTYGCLDWIANVRSIG